LLGCTCSIVHRSAVDWCETRLFGSLASASLWCRSEYKSQERKTHENYLQRINNSICYDITVFNPVEGNSSTIRRNILASSSAPRRETRRKQNERRKREKSRYSASQHRRSIPVPLIRFSCVIYCFFFKALQQGERM
jgi:hypothetical protein